MAYHYDKGGILTKSDVGSFLYNNTTKPYALSEISPASAIIPNGVDSLTYTSFESVKTIQEDPYSATFVYNADNGRAKMEVKQNTTTILTRWYPEGGYIKETASGTTKEYTFIGGDPYTAPVVGITQSGTTTYYYLLRDHLGSITHVVDASTGTLSYQYSYDAWGRMCTTGGWVNYNPGSEPALFVAGRGFTGHEHLPWFNLINMNGRVYDPLVGQFLSPDNFIQDPFNSQNLNRYSYCVNNPLKYYDISGMSYYGGAYTYNSFGTAGHQTIKEMLDQLFGAASSDIKMSQSDQQSFWSYYEEAASSGGGDPGAYYEEAASSGGGDPGGDKYSVIMVSNPVGFGFIPVVVPQGQGGVGQPGAWEGLIPIWGSGRAAIDHFQKGNWGRGLLNTGIAISDVFLVKSIGTAIGKGAWKLGSHSWSATRSWLGKTGYAEAGQPVHHWTASQATAKQYGLEAITNQPWNLMPMKSQALHQSVHGVGPNAFGPLGQFWYGTPIWFKSTIVSGGGRIGD